MTEKEMPSRVSIVFGMAATAAAMISAAYIGIGLWSVREVVGFVLGLVLSALFLMGTIGLITARADAILAKVRREARIEPAQFRRFVPAPMPPPDVTARIYREPPTEVIRINGSDW